MTRSWTSLFFTALILLAGFTASVFACTNFRITANDGTVIIARSMEFAVNMHSNIRTSLRNRSFQLVAPDGTPGLEWKAKYGYVFLDGMNVDAALDGMNEEGLSIQNLFFPGYAEYQTVPTGHNKQALNYINFADWILSNFKTIDEVKKALPSVYVFGQKMVIPGQGDVLYPLHFSIFDATGKGIVVEYVKGKLNVYDNPMGVMTNSPSFDWHITNQSNFVQLLPTNPKPVIDNGVLINPTGEGAGLIGLPGDISPPSRFVKMSVLTRLASPADNAAGALNLAEHIINNVDIPLGLVREPTNGNILNETTQWVVFKDLTNKIFYYRTYNNLTLRAIDLKKLDFSEHSERLQMPINSEPYIQDMSDKFMKSAQPIPAVQTANAH